jgi:hypothetical protein
MLFIISAVGVVGAMILGLDGLMLASAGRGGQLELIVAIAFVAVAAAGVVGLLADDGRRDHTARGLFGHPDILHVVAVAPIMALSVGVFVATLIPSVYVALPFFAVWYWASGAARARRTERHGRIEAAREHPAYGSRAPAYP